MNLLGTHTTPAAAEGHEPEIRLSKDSLISHVRVQNDEITHLRNSVEHLERQITAGLRDEDRAAYVAANHGPVPLSVARENAQLRRNLLVAENRIALLEGRAVQELRGEVA